ncbi:MAG TPA: hypothetical protein VKF59_10125 [Candidatus Dormibacteraeota bacterium]|nr:hypothetical protein [Candidatus Dormibacteraeota bacterium]
MAPDPAPDAERRRLLEVPHGRATGLVAALVADAARPEEDRGVGS